MLNFCKRSAGAFKPARTFTAAPSRRLPSRIPGVPSLTPGSVVTNTAPMRAVTRSNEGLFTRLFNPGQDGQGMVFHEQVPAEYFPMAPEKDTDQVMLSVRAAAINSADYKVHREDILCVCVLVCVCVCARARVLNRRIDVIQFINVSSFKSVNYSLVVNPSVELSIRSHVCTISRCRFA